MVDADDSRGQARLAGPGPAGEQELVREAKALLHEAKAQLKSEVREARAQAAGQARAVKAEAIGQAREQLQQAHAQLRLAQERAREQRARDRERRDRDRERRIAEHVSRDRERRLTQPPQRGRGLSREDIIDAAIAVADAEGTEAVSMRRIARELGTGTMSLYWHVSSKDELQSLMLDAVQAELPEPSGDWRADLTAFARATREGLIRHPWAIDYLVSGPPAGPREAGNGERLLAALDGLGLDLQTMTWIAVTTATYVAGAVIREAREIRWHRESEAMFAAMTAEEEQQWRAKHVAYLDDPDRYPHMARLFAEGVDPDAPETREARFQFGLDTLLDGIAARFGLEQPG